VADHHHRLGDVASAVALWREALERYSRPDAEFLRLTGAAGNPGVDEAEHRLAQLGAQ